MKPPPRAVREPKLNPNAKRPASIRDHKQNDAYCVWKIMEDLRRITGSSLPPAALPSTSAATKPKGKKPRKSAPATLESRHVLPESDITPKPPRGKAAGKAKPLVIAASSPAPRDLPEELGIVANADSSISAAVKNRKRKSAITWRMIGGVETRVSLNDERKEVIPPPLPTTKAVLRPSPIDIPRYRLLPQPTPSPLAQQPPSFPPSRHTQIPLPHHHHMRLHM